MHVKWTKELYLLNISPTILQNGLITKGRKQIEDYCFFQNIKKQWVQLKNKNIFLKIFPISWPKMYFYIIYHVSELLYRCATYDRFMGNAKKIFGYS